MKEWESVLEKMGRMPQLASVISEASTITWTAFLN